jgi:hypothetical protein
MNRRDFLMFRTEDSQRVAELSCEKLFMHFQDLSSGFQQATEEAGTLDDADWWAGEPPLSIHGLDPETFFRGVLGEMGETDCLRVLDMEWLAQGDFRIRVETLLAAFKAQGGEVLFKNSNPQTSKDEEVNLAL